MPETPNPSLPLVQPAPPATRRRLRLVYLPYQLHATPEQFRRAYPRAAEFVALKRRLDPTNKFRNELLDKYLYPR